MSTGGGSVHERSLKMQTFGATTTLAPQVSGHPLGLPEVAQAKTDSKVRAMDADTKSANAENHSQSQEKNAKAAASRRDAGNPSAPPTILQLKIDEMLREQREALERNMPDPEEAGEAASEQVAQAQLNADYAEAQLAEMQAFQDAADDKRADLKAFQAAAQEQRAETKAFEASANEARLDARADDVVRRDALADAKADDAFFADIRADQSAADRIFADIRADEKAAMTRDPFTKLSVARVQPQAPEQPAPTPQDLVTAQTAEPNKPDLNASSEPAETAKPTL